MRHFNGSLHILMQRYNGTSVQRCVLNESVVCGADMMESGAHRHTAC
jgi:hypothetical protein